MFYWLLSTASGRLFGSAKGGAPAAPDADRRIESSGAPATQTPQARREEV